MFTQEMISILMLGFGLGLLHAFDADHVMAVSVMSAEEPSVKRSFKFASSWAIGHGGVLLCLALIATTLGFQLPEAWVSFFEHAVGVLLIGLGGWLLWKLRAESLAIASHTHDGITHTHIHNHEHTSKNDHKPVLVGVLHGLAGSAPVLALIPAIQQGAVLAAVSYVALFSFGVLASMVGFGFGLGYVQRGLQHWHQKLFNGLRVALGFSSIGIGAYWLVGG